MSWSLIDYECLMDKDDYSIIVFKVNDVKDYETEDTRYLENVTTFLDDLRGLYKSQDLTRQINVDFPREVFYVNDIKIKDYSNFLKELGCTNFLEETIMISTQSSMFPVTLKLFEEFRDTKEDIHVSDFMNINNPLIFKFKIFSKNHLYVNIEKKFRIIKIINGDPHILRLLKVNTIIEIDDKNKDIYYSVVEIKNKKLIKQSY